MLMTQQLLPVFLLLTSLHHGDAFVPHHRPAVSVKPSKTVTVPSHSGIRVWSTLSDKDQQQATSGTSTSASSLTSTSPSFNNYKKQLYYDMDDSQNCVELDTTGRLRLCNRPDVLVQGLDPTVWSATRANNGNSHSLFLHTAHPESASEHQTSLGNLISCRRLIACARQNRYWMGPKTGASAADIPFDTQFLLIEIEEDEQYALFLPLVDNGFRASLHHHQDDGSLSVICAAESGDAAVTNNGMRALYVSVGNDPYKLVKEGLADVAEATGTFDVLDNKQIPSSVDDFGWCTWDAFYSNVTPEGILDGVQALQDAGVPPRTLILDDGWQQVNPLPPGWTGDSIVVRDKDVAIDPAKEEPNLLQAMMLKVVDAIATPFVQMVTGFYNNCVRTAPHGSLPNQIWSLLANTVLKPGLWNFFDSETDFNRQLDGFKANHKFENSNTTLKSLVTELKGDHGIKSVYCWHALHGYWRGVSEDLGKRMGIQVTNSFPKPSQSLKTLEPHSAWDPVTLWGVGVMTTPEDLDKFYTHLHTPLVEAGVDGVKVDVQSGVSSAGDGVGGGPHISKLYMKAMEKSVSERFPSDKDGAVNCINCMCHSTENIYRHKQTSVARASEDFFPDRPESHTAHLVNVAYNSLFLGEICLPDWDMFHSLHESAALHAAARAVGGCPVYVSDKPGEHAPELLRKLVLPDGSLLRAQQPGRPTRDCLFADVTADATTALKIWNVNNNGNNGVVGAFNVQGVAWNFETHENEVLDSSPGSITTEIKPYDVEAFRQSGEDGPFVAWRHRARTMDFLKDGDSAVKQNLAHREWEIVTMVPIQIQDDNLMWAPVGLVDMMNSGGALLDDGTFDHDPTDPSIRRAQFQCRGPGRFVAFTNKVPSRVLVEGRMLDFFYDDKTGELSFILPSEEAERKAHSITVEWD